MVVACFFIRIRSRRHHEAPRSLQRGEGYPPSLHSKNTSLALPNSRVYHFTSCGKARPIYNLTGMYSASLLDHFQNARNAIACHVF